MTACLIDIDLFNLDENGFFNSSDLCQEKPEATNGMATVPRPFPNLISPTESECVHTKISDSTILCTYCYGPLAVYMLSYERAIKLCTNPLCQQYLNNSFHLSSCVFDTNLMECAEKHPRPSESQAKHLKDILTGYIDSIQARLTKHTSESIAPNFAANKSQSPTYQKDELWSFDFADLLSAPEPVVPQHNELNFDLDFNPDANFEFDLSQIDKEFGNIDQINNSSFRAQLEEEAAEATTLTELKPVNSSELASKMAADVLKEQFLSHDEVLVSHSKKDASSITIVKNIKSHKQEVKIVDDVGKDDLISYIQGNSPSRKQQPQLKPFANTASIVKTNPTQAEKKPTTLLPWEIKNKTIKRKPRIEMDEIVKETPKPTASNKYDPPPKISSSISKTNLSRSVLEDKSSLKAKGSALKNALLSDSSFLSSLSMGDKKSFVGMAAKSTENYKDLVLNVLKKKPTSENI